jgi:hypothetical protein
MAGFAPVRARSTRWRGPQDTSVVSGSAPRRTRADKRIDILEVVGLLGLATFSLVYLYIIAKYGSLRPKGLHACQTNPRPNPLATAVTCRSVPGPVNLPDLG